MQAKSIWLALTAGAFWLLMFVGTHLPKNSGGREYGLDKVAHFSAFAILAVLILLAVSRWRGGLAWFHLVGVVALLSCYGIFDEITQALLTTTRKADFNDWIADTLGAAAGALIAFYFVGGTSRGSKNLGSEK